MNTDHQIILQMHQRLKNICLIQLSTFFKKKKNEMQTSFLKKYKKKKKKRMCYFHIYFPNS